MGHSFGLQPSSVAWSLRACFDLLPSEGYFVANLLDILLEEPECKALVKLDLLGVPLALQLPVVRQDLVDHFQYMARTLLEINNVSFSHEIHQNHEYDHSPLCIHCIG